MLKPHLAIDCVWGEWENGACSKTCGGGKRTNTRTKKVTEKHGGMCETKDCTETSGKVCTETNDCNGEECPG